ncbi:MAG: sigma-70 family RNA polymerase sigma factor [Patescibacteria group bacterium]
MTASEKELIEAAKKDKRVFAQLYDLHFKPIYHFLLSRVADGQLAEDITSDTFMIAMEKIDSYKYTGKPFRAWIYRIAINELNQHYRKKKREQEAFIREWHDVGEGFEAADMDIKEKESAEEELNHVKQLNEAFHLLKNDEQDLLSLRYFQEMSYNEIAETLNTTVNNVGVKLNRAVNRLSQLCNFELS